jgi:hypothetical protein
MQPTKPGQIVKIKNHIHAQSEPGVYILVDDPAGAGMYSLMTIYQIPEFFRKNASGEYPAPRKVIYADLFLVAENFQAYEDGWFS